MKYKKAIVGGTFDHFHAGHKKLLATAFSQAEHVTIGLTTKEMYQHKFLAEAIEDYDNRLSVLKQYLSENNFLSRTEIIPINDIYGTTLTDKDIEVIFATEENLNNVNLINQKRHEIVFPELEIIVVPYVKDDNGTKITSERIRKGEIDRKGLVYANIFTQTLIMPDTLREKLHHPLGEIIRTTDELLPLLKDKLVISVGDVITAELKKNNFIPAISIIDFKTRRHEVNSDARIDGIRVENKQSTINNSAVNLLKEAFNHFFTNQTMQTIIVEGEEDLLALPAILLAPLNAIVVYGQYDQGIVINHITEDLKQKVLNLLGQFS